MHSSNAFGMMMKSAVSEAFTDALVRQKYLEDAVLYD